MKTILLTVFTAFIFSANFAWGQVHLMNYYSDRKCYGYLAEAAAFHYVSGYSVKFRKFPGSGDIGLDLLDRGFKIEPARAGARSSQGANFIFPVTFTSPQKEVKTVYLILEPIAYCQTQDSYMEAGTLPADFFSPAGMEKWWKAEWIRRANPSYTSAP